MGSLRACRSDTLGQNLYGEAYEQYQTYKFQLGDEDTALKWGIFGSVNHRLPGEEVVFRNRPSGEHIVWCTIGRELLIFGHEAS